MTKAEREMMELIQLRGKLLSLNEEQVKQVLEMIKERQEKAE